MPVPCPVLANVNQRKIQGSEYYEVSWRNIDGLHVSVVPGDLVRSACPEKITNFLENKDAQKKQKRRARPKNPPVPSEPRTGGFDVQVEESPLFRHGTGMAGEADSSWRSDGHSSEVVEPAMIDLSSPSPVKVDKSRRNDKKPDQDCEAGSSQYPQHERKARELRLFLNSIRDELY